MQKKVFNYAGKDISGCPLRLRDEKFGYVDKDNKPHINWGSETPDCDKDGFDKNYRPISGEETHVVENFLLPKGIVICRYGSPDGFFTTIKGTPYDALSLPYVKETIEYHEYLVSSDVEVSCYVTRGLVGPKFKSHGGAIQFMHKQPIRLECEDGFLQEDDSWRQKDI